MRNFVVLAVFVSSSLFAAVASAETYDATQPIPAKDGYIGVGAEFGGQRALMGGVKIDGGYRLGDTPLFARGQITGGASGSDGNYQQVRAGIESRGCIIGGLLCAFAGVDVGYQHDHMVDKPWFNWGCSDTNPCTDQMDEVDAHDLMAVPRVGVEVGTPIRVRAALDIPVTTRLDERENRAGAALSLGVGFAF